MKGKQKAGAGLARYLDQKSLNEFIYKDKEPGHFDPPIQLQLKLNKSKN